MSDSIKIYYMDAPEPGGYTEFEPDYDGRGSNYSMGKNEVSIISTLLRNAGGVPYHISLSADAESVYISNAGEGISKLFGIDPGSFTEDVYREMIERFVPLEQGISADVVEARTKLLSGMIKNYRAEVLIRTPEGDYKKIYEVAVPVYDPITEIFTGVSGWFFDAGKWSSSAGAPLNAESCDKETDLLKIAFLRNISHEIRTPLNAIIGFSTLLGEYFKNDETARDYINMIMESTDKLLETIDRIVEISLLQSGNITLKRDKVNIAESTRNIFKKYKPLAEKKGLRLVLYPPFGSTDITIISDRHKLTKVLQNLVDNAIKFTDDGEVSLEYTVAGSVIDFFVRDTGIGIPTEYKDKVFDVFFQADAGPTRLYGGTGLGLSISKAYIEMLGGKLWFTSDNGQGTTFRFTIPYIQ